MVIFGDKYSVEEDTFTDSMMNILLELFEINWWQKLLNCKLVLVVLVVLIDSELSLTMHFLQFAEYPG